MEGVGWAFTHSQIGHWEPLTTLSHMVDSSFTDCGPAGHHLTNVLLQRRRRSYCFSCCWK